MKYYVLILTVFLFYDIITQIAKGLFNGFVRQVENFIIFAKFMLAERQAFFKAN